MTLSTTTAAIESFISCAQNNFVREDSALSSQDLSARLDTILSSESLGSLLLALIDAPAFSDKLGKEFAAASAVSGISTCRSLRSCLNFSLSRFFTALAELVAAFDKAEGGLWYEFAMAVSHSECRDEKLLNYLLKGARRAFYTELSERLVKANPHAIYPTSSYRESVGSVESTADDQVIEAVVGSRTFTSIRIVDHTLDPSQTALKDVYVSQSRCVCLVDQNVEQFYGEQLEHYFDYHGIPLEKLVYRAMEVDKGIYTVEKMLGDFKRLGISRNEPVLIVGGGVLADTGGLACALYHRNTPYVMLSTSIVAGVDAGPSPRTCCDGFGYKNLFGAYHPPVLSLTDRFFFKTLREGWLRHGIIEIIKMAVVKDAELFDDLEKAGAALISTRFGTLNCEEGEGEKIGSEERDRINTLSKKILGGAIRSYVAAEYNNLYETHQCRPHAYGHTWSPGFEIEAGLLHGHAVAIGMGFGAYLSHKLNWISKQECDRIMRLISTFGLSLWHEVLENKETLWASQEKIFQKRGQNLVAPLPKGEIGQCGYLNELSKEDLFRAIEEYRIVCKDYPRQGLGIDPHCSDVGLENPATVGQPIADQALSEHPEAQSEDQAARRELLSAV